MTRYPRIDWLAFFVLVLGLGVSIGAWVWIGYLLTGLPWAQIACLIVSASC